MTDTTIKATITSSDVEEGDVVCSTMKGKYFYSKVLKVLPHKLLTTNASYAGILGKIHNTEYHTICQVFKLNKVIKTNKFNSNGK